MVERISTNFTNKIEMASQFAAAGRFLILAVETKRKKQIKFNLASWNVRTLLNSITTKSERPERRTALVTRELARYGVDIAALTETHFADKGQLTEIGGGYTFFWSGRSIDERREVFGPKTRNHQGWFDENDVGVQKLLEEKRQLYKAHLDDRNSASKKYAYDDMRREVQRKLPTGEECGAIPRSLHDLCESYKRFWHGVQKALLEDHVQVWLPGQACEDCEAASRRDDGPSTR
eukprot:gene9596-17354_t